MFVLEKQLIVDFVLIIMFTRNKQKRQEKMKKLSIAFGLAAAVSMSSGVFAGGYESMLYQLVLCTKQ